MLLTKKGLLASLLAALCVNVFAIDPDLSTAVRTAVESCSKKKAAKAKVKNIDAAGKWVLQYLSSTALSMANTKRKQNYIKNQFNNVIPKQVETSLKSYPDDVKKIALGMTRSVSSDVNSGVINSKNVYGRVFGKASEILNNINNIANETLLSFQKTGPIEEQHAKPVTQVTTSGNVTKQVTLKKPKKFIKKVQQNISVTPISFQQLVLTMSIDDAINKFKKLLSDWVNRNIDSNNQDGFANGFYFLYQKIMNPKSNATIDQKSQLLGIANIIKNNDNVTSKSENKKYIGSTRLAWLDDLIDPLDQEEGVGLPSIDIIDTDTPSSVLEKIDKLYVAGGSADSLITSLKNLYNWLQGNNKSLSYVEKIVLIKILNDVYNKFNAETDATKKALLKTNFKLLLDDIKSKKKLISGREGEIDKIIAALEGQVVKTPVEQAPAEEQTQVEQPPVQEQASVQQTQTPQTTSSRGRGGDVGRGRGDTQTYQQTTTSGGGWR